MRIFANIVLILTIIVSLSCSSEPETELTSYEIDIVERPEQVSKSTLLPDSYTVPEIKEDTPFFAVTPIGLHGLAAFDETIPDAEYNAYYIYHQNLESLSNASDIIFVGRIIDYHESVLEYSPTDSLNGAVDIYDAIIFSVEELISGELQSDSEQVSMLIYSLISTSKGTPMVRISASPIEILIPGIEQRNLTEGPRYLIYGRQEDSEPFNRSGFYYFVTPGSVAPIIAEDTLGIGVAKPLNTALTVDGEDLHDSNSLSLSDVRAAAQVASNNQDSQDIEAQTDDSGAFPDDESTPVGEIPRR